MVSKRYLIKYVVGTLDIYILLFDIKKHKKYKIPSEFFYIEYYIIYNFIF